MLFHGVIHIRTSEYRMSYNSIPHKLTLSQKHMHLHVMSCHLARCSLSRVCPDLLDVMLDDEVVTSARLHALDGCGRVVGQNDALALGLELSLAGREGERGEGRGER